MFTDLCALVYSVYLHVFLYLRFFHIYVYIPVIYVYIPVVALRSVRFLSS
jgi:hypothetical protein